MNFCGSVSLGGRLSMTDIHISESVQIERKKGGISIMKLSVDSIGYGGYPQKNYMIDTFLRHRILNPKKMKNCQEISVFSQKIDISWNSI